jgi:hypothetical protein
MFLTSDTMGQRQQKIRSFMSTEPVIAVLLAAADFEWTTRRAILALGKSPTKSINACLRAEKKGGLKALQGYWKDEVKPRLGSDLATIVPDWNFFATKAYDLRHKLVHGAQGTTGKAYAGRAVEAMLNASKAVAEYAAKNGEPVYGRQIRRIKPRP